MKNTSLITKKQFVLLATTAISFLIAFAILSQNALALTFTKSVPGYYKQLEARAVEYYMNRDRKSGDGFYIDSNGVKHAAAKDHDIVMDANLEAVARQRAAELVLNYSHVRPNGNSFDTLAVNSIRSYQEYIFQMPVAAAGKDSSLDAYATWFNVGKGPAGFSMMSNNFKSCGCACFVYGGTEYWVLEFSIQASTNAVLPNISTANTNVTVEYDYDTVKKTYKISAPNTTTIELGNSLDKYNFTFSEYLGSYKVRDIEPGLTHCTTSTSNSNIAIASDGKITGNNAGKCTVTFSFTLNDGLNTPMGSASFTVTVSKTSIARAASYYNGSNAVYLPDQTYTGQAIKPVFTLKFMNSTLKEGTDYTVQYSDNINKGRATITITGIGNKFNGTKYLYFDITAVDISKGTLSIPATSYTYTGNSIEPVVTVKLPNGQVLKADQDYFVSYSDNRKIGTATIKVYGKTNYTGTLTKTFTITKANLANASVSSIDDYTYKGSAIVPEYVNIKLQGSNSYLGSDDYTVTYDNNVNAGTATITFTGKNNCTGTKKVSFNILPYDLNNKGWISLEYSQLTYTGSEIKPAYYDIKYNNMILKLGTDYTLTYKDNINVGKGKMTATGKGNYTGTVSADFTILPASIKTAKVTGISDKVYTGKAITFSNIVVNLDGKILKEGSDYKVNHYKNTNVGEGFVQVTGIGNYAYTETIYFKISPADFTKATVTFKDSYPYACGNYIYPAPVVKWTNGEILQSGVDYICTYKNNNKPGTATVTITGKNNFAGTIDTSFTISKADISTAIAPSISDRNYNGEPHCPLFTLSLPDSNGTTLPYSNYTVTYKNNVNAGTASIIITGQNYCTGTKTITFKINPIKLSVSPTLSKNEYEYTGKAIKPKLGEMKISGSLLVEGVDFTVSYSSNVKVGTGKVTITGKGNYYGSLSTTFTINPKGLEKASVAGVSDHIAIGSPITFPNLKVTLNGVSLKAGKDYTVKYENNTKPGKATVIITGIGNYCGQCKKQFTITEPSSRAKGVAAFVERLYTVALNRPFDPVGKKDWVDALLNGADGATAAHGFFFSDEFINQKLSNEEYVKRLYLTFMDRQPDAAGFNAWVKALNEGVSREVVFQGFINSTEWANICLEFGIKSGGTGVPTIRLKPSPEILAFAERLYTTCLGRSADGAGLKAWAEALANREATGAKVAHGFFFSDEFIGKKYSNKEFVRRCYLTFMNREPDKAGYDAWVKALNDGATREQVFNGFVKSAEFIAICKDAGIDPY